MQQKIIWIMPLIIGISAVFLAGSCGKANIEYSVKADFVYKNETEYTIRYSQIALDNSDTVELFRINPRSEKVLTINGEGDKNPVISTCCEGFLGDLQGTRFPILVSFDNKCIRYTEGQGPTTTNLDNYQSEKIAERHFRFTYRFTEADYQKATECQ